MENQFPRKILFAILVLLISLGLIMAVGFLMTPKISSTHQLDTTQSNFYSADSNLSLHLEPAWQSISTTILKLPNSIFAPEFGLNKIGSPCVLVYATMPRSWFENYKQTSFGDRVFTSEKEQLSSSWYLRLDQLPSNFAFAREGRQPLPNEVRISPFPLNSDPLNGLTKAFLLYNQNGSIVSDDCNQQASSILSSLRRVFEPVSFTTDSKGIIYIDWLRQKAGLYYRTDIDAPSKKVMDLNFAPDIPPAIYRNKIYFVENGGLKTLDLFTRQINDVPGLEGSTADEINDFYFFGDHIFVLRGPNCNGYMAKCNLTLVDYNVASGQSSPLASNLIYRDIMGYNNQEDTLYLIHREGDAGCDWVQMGKYRFPLRVVEPVLQYSVCDSDTPNADQIKLTELTARFANQVSQPYFLSIENGKIVEPPDSGGKSPYRGGSSWRYFR